MLRLTHLLAQVRIMGTLGVDAYRVRTMIELLNHSALVQRKKQLISLFPTVATDWVEAICFKLTRCVE